MQNINFLIVVNLIAAMLPVWNMHLGYQISLSLLGYHTLLFAVQTYRQATKRYPPPAPLPFSFPVFVMKKIAIEGREEKKRSLKK